MISREEAIDIIKYASAFNSANSPLTKALDMAIEALSQPERPKGRWVKDGDWLICMECDSEINVKNSIGNENRRNFCPNCGADMRGEEE